MLKKMISVLLLVLCFSAPAPAMHKIYVEAYVETGATIMGEARYHSTPAAGAVVRVIAPDRTVLLEMRTDDNGEFRFEAPYRCDLVIDVLDAGHKGSFTIPAEDLPENLPPYESKK